MPARRRAEFLERLVDAIPGGEATLRGDRIEITFNRFGYGLVFAAKRHGR